MNEMPEVYGDRFRTSRIDCDCSNCGFSRIKRGSRYLEIKGLWSGEWERYKICLDCNEVIKNFQAIDKNLSYEDGPALERGGIRCFLEDFLCQSYEVEDLIKDLNQIFDVSDGYFEELLHLNNTEDK